MKIQKVDPSQKPAEPNAVLVGNEDRVEAGPLLYWKMQQTTLKSTSIPH